MPDNPFCKEICPNIQFKQRHARATLVHPLHRTIAKVTVLKCLPFCNSSYLCCGWHRTPIFPPGYSEINWLRTLIRCLGHAAGKCAKHRGEEEENSKREMAEYIMKYKSKEAVSI